MTSLGTIQPDRPSLVSMVPLTSKEGMQQPCFQADRGSLLFASDSPSNVNFKKRLPLSPLKQVGNACGTTSLATVFTAMGKPSSQEVLDKRIRKADVWTPLRSMVAEAKEAGLFAELYSKTTFDEIVANIKADRLMIALIDTNTKKYGLNSHYVVIHGVESKPESKLKLLVITNPASGKTTVTDFDTFEKRWKDPRYLNVNVGFNNTMIAISKRDDLPLSPHKALAQEADRVGYAGNQLANAWVDAQEGNYQEAAKRATDALQEGVKGLGQWFRKRRNA